MITHVLWQSPPAPAQRHRDLGTVATDSTGVKTWTGIAEALAANTLYWVCVAAQTATCGARAIAAYNSYIFDSAAFSGTGETSHLSMTGHAITIRPLCFSGKTFKKLDKNLQAAVLRAGKEAGAHGRQIESSEDEAKLVKLEKEGKLKRVPFAGRDQMKKLVDPVMAAYAKEIGAEQILAKINAIK